MKARAEARIPIALDVPDGEAITVEMIEEDGSVGEPIDITDIAVNLMVQMIEKRLWERELSENGPEIGRITVPDGTVATINHHEVSTAHILDYLAHAVINLIVEAAEAVIEESEDEVEDG